MNIIARHCKLDTPLEGKCDVTSLTLDRISSFCTTLLNTDNSAKVYLRVCPSAFWGCGIGKSSQSVSNDVVKFSIPNAML